MYTDHTLVEEAGRIPLVSSLVIEPLAETGLRVFSSCMIASSSAHVCQISVVCGDLWPSHKDVLISPCVLSRTRDYQSLLEVF